MLGLEGFNAHTKYRILQHALEGGNISRTCELFGISRPTFYKWQEAYQKFGITGLKNKERAKPQMPNKVSKAIEKEILDYVLRHPKDGPRRIFYELKSEGIQVGETGIFNVLKRQQLTSQEERLAYAQKRGLSAKGSRTRKNSQLLRVIQKEKSYPGYLVVQKLDDMGSFDKIGKVYQYSFYDTESQWVEVKLYNRKNDIDVWDFFESKLVYLLEVFGLSFENLVTDKERTFLPYFLGSQGYEEILSAYSIKPIFCRLKEEEAFREIVDFNKVLVTEFYSKVRENHHWDSFDKLDREITKFVRDHNFKKTIASGAYVGKTPAQVVLEYAVAQGADLNLLPLWILALINSASEGGK